MSKASKILDKYLDRIGEELLEDSWDDLDDKTKRDIDSAFVSCTQNYEKRYIYNRLKKKYPTLKNLHLINAIEHCCNTVPGNKPRDDFYQCLDDFLSKKN